jgi:secretion/DNA translocation related CpaE-like protein
VLPNQDGELMAELSDAADASRDEDRRGAIVGVIAGRGGAGASVFATALAQSAADALLVDADPWGGGIDLVLGCERETGLRWPDLTLQGGRLSYTALRDALPQRHGVSVLSGGRTGSDIDAVPLGAVIDAGSRGGTPGICALPRRSTDAVETVLDAADLVVVVAPADVRSCAAAAAIAPWVSAGNPNAGVVVRGPSPGGLRSVDVAEIVGLPLLARMRSQPGVADDLERGGLRLRRRSPLAAAARRVLAVLHRHQAAAA